ncbi:MAG TPA: septal ring lytic transglycosylase RlpA family protein [Holophaga sp.]|nr:septal ring lytic transglycosylase RlpA family protein [Holophaga sp.]
MFNIWIEDIQVQFRPISRAAMSGGVLRRIRSATRVSATLVILFFSLHCTKPSATSVRKPAKHASPLPEEPGTGGFYTETGEASWYGSAEDGFEGKFTAGGDLMDSGQLTCAHRTLPIGTLLEVENRENGKRAIVRVNDRGPFIRGRILDVSLRAAKDLGFLAQGTATVTIRAVEKDGTPARNVGPVNGADPFTLQVAALSDPAGIEALSRDLQLFVGPVTLQEATTRNGQSVKRVLVGSYLTMAEAEKASELVALRFGARGVEPFITRRR